MRLVLNLLLVYVSAASEPQSFVSYLQPNLLLAHGLLPLDVPALLAQDSIDATASKPYFACGPLSEFHTAKSSVEAESGHVVHTSYVSKRHDKGCFLAFASHQVAGRLRGIEGHWLLEGVPEMLKVHPSALSYLQRLDEEEKDRRLLLEQPRRRQRHRQRKSRGGNEPRAIRSLDKEESESRFGEDAANDGESENINDDKLLEHEILIEFVSSAVSFNGRMQEVWKAVLSSLVLPRGGVWGSLSIDKRLREKPWNKLVAKYLLQDGHRVVYPLECATHLAASKVSFRSHSVIIPTSNPITGESSLSAACVTSVLHAASAHPSVLRVATQPLTQLTNYEARGIVQGGTLNEEPYREAGLEGQGQICGIADSGVNDLSCFFLDNSGAYPTVTTNRSGVVEPLRRKIIQYVSHADDLDEEGGHGTHVCGTVAGSSLQEFGHMNGMAPQAKIAFFDIGVTDRDYLKLPATDDIFNAAYTAGARIHTNSWGNLGGLYGQMSFDVDKFVFEHPDFLVVFAAGNSGDLGGKSIISPGNSKNALSVGAGQVRTVLTDELRTPGNENTALAYFSSLGPTTDGRMKPDIIAPGDFIESAFSGPPDLLRAAIDQGAAWNGHESCAAHQMSGTSMAAPATAGSALLIRQYFMDEAFWATTCNKAYKRCKDGSFAPTGYLLKGLILHSGNPVRRYSDPMYDSESVFLDSFELAPPPDNYQGYGQVLLKNVLPLRNKKGLHPDLQLIVFDELELTEHSTLVFDIAINPKEVRENRPIKVTVSWYDPPSLVGSAASLLLHDLDLAVHAPNGDLFLGNRGSQVFRLPSLKYSDEQPLPGSDVGSVNSSTHSSSPQPAPMPYVVMDRDFLDANTDFANPNEQVFIAHPHCSSSSPDAAMAMGFEESDESTKKKPGRPDATPKNPPSACTYRVYIHANTLTEFNTQKFAAVFTIPRSAVLQGPVVTNSWVRIPEIPAETFAPTPTMTVANLGFSVKLAGTEYDKFSVFVPFCTTLQRIEMWMSFARLDASDAWPSNIELTFVTPSGDALAIGGADSSLGLATKITEWPSAWIDTKPGNYYATVAVSSAGLRESGEWKVFAMNSWSSSGLVWYNASIVMSFANAEGSDLASCSPTPQPSPKSTVAPTLLPTFLPGSDPMFDPTASFRHQHAIHFQDVSLGVRESPEDATKDSKTHIHSDAIAHNDAVLIEAFNYTGTLESVAVKLDGLVNGAETRGTDSWFFTVTVTDFRGLEVQVGGYEWLAARDRFYCRRWPEPWVGKESRGRFWAARRDVHAAGLQGCREPWRAPPEVKPGPRLQGSTTPQQRTLLSSGAAAATAAAAAAVCPPFIRSTAHRFGADEWLTLSGDVETGMWVPSELLVESESGKVKHAYDGSAAPSMEGPSTNDTLPAIGSLDSTATIADPAALPHPLRHRNTDWLVRISLGYPWGSHQPVNFSGTVYLTFRTGTPTSKAVTAEESEAEKAIFGEDSWNGADIPPEHPGQPTLAPTFGSHSSAGGKNSSIAHGGKGKHGLNDNVELKSREQLMWKIVWFLLSIWLLIGGVLAAAFTSGCAPLRRACGEASAFCSTHVLPAWAGDRLSRQTQRSRASSCLTSCQDAQSPQGSLGSSAHGLLAEAARQRPPPYAHDPTAVYPSLSQNQAGRRGDYGSTNI